MIGANFQSEPYTTAIAFPDNVRIIWDKKQPLGSAKREIEKDKGSVPGQRRIFFTVNPGETFKYVAKRLADTEKDRARDGEAFWQKQKRAPRQKGDEPRPPSKDASPVRPSPAVIPIPSVPPETRLVDVLTKLREKHVKAPLVLRQQVAALLDPIIDNEELMIALVDELETRASVPRQKLGKKVQQLFVNWAHDQLFSVEVFVKNEATRQLVAPAAATGTIVTFDAALSTEQFTEYAIRMTPNPLVNRKLLKYVDHMTYIAEERAWPLLANWLQGRVGTVYDFTKEPWDEMLLIDIHNLRTGPFEYPKRMPPRQPAVAKELFADVQPDTAIMQEPVFATDPYTLFHEDDTDALQELREKIAVVFLNNFQQWFFHPDRLDIPATSDSVGTEAMPGPLYANYVRYLRKRFPVLVNWSDELTGYEYGDAIGLTLVKKFNLDPMPHERPASASESE